MTDDGAQSFDEQLANDPERAERHEAFAEHMTVMVNDTLPAIREVAERTGLDVGLVAQMIMARQIEALAVTTGRMADAFNNWARAQREHTDFARQKAEEGDKIIRRALELMEAQEEELRDLRDDDWRGGGDG